jgi:hypothetical protein
MGEEHPDTLTSMNNLASTLMNQGDLAGALVLQEKVLEARRRVLGEMHMDTLSAVRNLGTLLNEMGETERAFELMIEAVKPATSDPIAPLDNPTFLGKQVE